MGKLVWNVLHIFHSFLSSLSLSFAKTQLPQPDRSSNTRKLSSWTSADLCAHFISPFTTGWLLEPGKACTCGSHESKRIVVANSENDIITLILFFLHFSLTRSRAPQQIVSHVTVRDFRWRQEIPHSLLLVPRVIIKFDNHKNYTFTVIMHFEKLKWV